MQKKNLDFPKKERVQRNQLDPDKDGPFFRFL